MRDLIILGTSCHGSEISEIVRRINMVGPQWNLLGFADVDEKKAGNKLNGYLVLGANEVVDKYPNATLIPSYEWPNKTSLPQDRLATIIDPSTFISSNVEIGAGSVIYPNCFIGTNAKTGRFLFCLSGSIINHDDILGDMVTVTSGVRLAGQVTIEDECYLGQACTVRQLLTIGRGSMVGMGAVVVRDVPPNSVMVGNPAKRLRDCR